MNKLPVFFSIRDRIKNMHAFHDLADSEGLEFSYTRMK